MQEQEKEKRTLAGEGVTFQQSGKEHLDFAVSIILAVICIAAIIASYGYYKASGNKFYESPGFMPTVIASAILFCCIILFVGSIKGSSIKERGRQVITGIPAAFKSSKFINSLAGLVIFGIYIFVLIKIFPFWLSSFILLCVCYIFSSATTPIKILVISVLSVAGIILLFQVAFSVPLP
jgi:TRAP-type C4-dicarboxylate transport system permease small subunit